MQRTLFFAISMASLGLMWPPPAPAQSTSRALQPAELVTASAARPVANSRALTPSPSTSVEVTPTQISYTTASQTQLSPGEGWQLVYAAMPGSAGKGSYARLLELARTEPKRLGVTISSFHGQVAGPCASVRVLEDDIVDCELKVWCQEHGVGEIPDAHGHNIHAFSTAQMQHIVVAMTPMRQERMVALENSDTTVAYYYK